MRSQNGLILLLALFALGTAVADVQAQRRSPKEKTLEERDPELAAWIDTLILNIQKDHRAVRNSSAQALIAIGSDAAPRLLLLRENGDRTARNLATRILERIARESGRNLFKEDLGGDRPEGIAKHCSQVLKLSGEKAESLEATIRLAQDEERKIRADLRNKMIESKQAGRLRENLKLATEVELGTYLDKKGVDFVMIRLGWGGKRTVDDNGDVVDQPGGRDGERRRDGEGGEGGRRDREDRR